MTEPLFKYSMITMKIAVYPDRITYKKSLVDGEKSIPINNVASIETGGVISSSVTIITTGGEKIKFPLIKNKKDDFKDAIYKAINMNRS